jgi:hypothetical protein
MRTLAALLIVIALSVPVQSAQRIMIDWGGRLDHYIERYNEWRRNGDLVVVDGMCISACTLVTGLIEHHRLCATPFRTFAREATRIVWRIYPPAVREILRRHGWQDGMDHPDLIYVEGKELYSIIRPCDSIDMLKMAGNRDE